jgi:hypothetical protein
MHPARQRNCHHSHTLHSVCALMYKTRSYTYKLTCTHTYTYRLIPHKEAREAGDLIFEDYRLEISPFTMRYACVELLADLVLEANGNPRLNAQLSHLSVKELSYHNTYHWAICWRCI